MPVLIAGNIEFEMVGLAPGSFQMGSGNDLFSEAPLHVVDIEREFLIGKFPITQQQWQAVVGANPAAFPASPQHPVENVSWIQAVEFCARLSGQARREVRLPSEAEWEYACRAGTQTEFFCGPWGPFQDESEIPQSLRRDLCEYAWFDSNSGERTHAVGEKRPNPWGLHDMIGNVWEWCADSWHDSYHGAPNDGSAWHNDFSRQPRRCLRGGAWDMNAFRCRSPYRSYDHCGLATNRFGLRIVAAPVAATNGELPNQPPRTSGEG